MLDIGRARSALGVIQKADGDNQALACFDEDRAMAAIRELLIAIGENPDRAGLQDTPARVARAYAEMTSGLRADPAESLRTLFSEQFSGVVIVRDIELQSLCEHHLLPFFGHAHIAYQPGAGMVAGLSKLARAVDVLARRPQIQERLTRQLVDAIVTQLGAPAAAVVVDCAHMCMTMRGVRKTSVSTVTVGVSGTLLDPAVHRAVLDQLMPGNRTQEPTS
jgi:GTP cyclohydrolase I